MFDFIKRTINGFTVLGKSFAILVKYPALISLSLIHGVILCTIITSILVAFHNRYHALFMQESIYRIGFGPIFALIIAWLVLYFSILIIDLFFAVTTARYYLKILQEKKEKLSQSIKHALKKLTIIIEWATTWSKFSLYRSSKPIDHCETDLKKDSKSALRALESILEFSWETANLLVPPIIAAENVTVTNLAKYENAYLKDSFGEKISVTFNFRFITLMSFALCVVTYAFVLTNLANLSIAQLILAMIALYMAVYTMCLLNSLKTIYKTLVYAYTQGMITNHKLLIEKSLVPLNR